MEEIMNAVALMESNQTEKAIQVLEDYLPLADEEEKYTIAELYMQWGYLEEASVLLNDLVQQFPGESELVVTLADVYIELDKDADAMELLNHIKEDDPAYVQALIQLADLYQAQGLFEVAEQKLLHAKQLEPNEVIIDFALGELYFSIGEYRKAATFYEKVLTKEKEIANVAINDRLAEAYAATGEYELALTFYQDSDNKNPDTLFKYGITATQAGRNDIAIKAWEQVIELDAYYHTVYLHLASVYEKEGMEKEAYETAKKGINVDEYNKELFFLAGNLAHKLNQNEESEKWIREAIALEPDYKEAVLFLTELLKKQDDFAGIIDLFDEIKNTGATDPLYEWELARAYYEIESYNDALNHYKEAYNNLNQDSDFLKEYGYFLSEEGRRKEALTIFIEYLKLNPVDDDIVSFVDRLEQAEEQ